MILLVALPALAACATPRVACLQSATRDLATVDRLIAETQGNLQRGYAYDRETYTSSSVDLCIGSGGWGRGYGGVGFSYCARPDTRVREVPVSIDRSEERRKLADLQKTRQRLAKESQSRLAQCNAKYPPSGPSTNAQ